MVSPGPRLSCPRGLGARALPGTGNFPNIRDHSPSSYTITHTQSAHAPPPTHTHTGLGGLQRHQIPSWEYRGCDFSICFSLSGQPSWGVLGQALLLDGGPPPCQGPLPGPAFPGSPLSSQTASSGFWAPCLLMARTSTTLSSARLSPPSPGFSAPATTSLPPQSHTLQQEVVQR